MTKLLSVLCTVNPIKHYITLYYRIMCTVAACLSYQSIVNRESRKQIYHQLKVMHNTKLAFLQNCPITWSENMGKDLKSVN